MDPLLLFVNCMSYMMDDSAGASLDTHVMGNDTKGRSMLAN